MMSKDMTKVNELVGETVRWFWETSTQKENAGKPILLCLACKKRLDSSEKQEDHQNHSKFQYNGGHAPVESKVIMSFVKAVLGIK